MVGRSQTSRVLQRPHTFGLYRNAADGEKQTEITVHVDKGEQPWGPIFFNASITSPTLPDNPRRSTWSPARGRRSASAWPLRPYMFSRFPGLGALSRGVRPMPSPASVDNCVFTDVPSPEIVARNALFCNTTVDY